MLSWTGLQDLQDGQEWVLSILESCQKAEGREDCCPVVLRSCCRKVALRGEAPLYAAGRRQDETTAGQQVAPIPPKDPGAGGMRATARGRRGGWRDGGRGRRDRLRWSLGTRTKVGRAELVSAGGADATSASLPMAVRSEAVSSNGKAGCGIVRRPWRLCHDPAFRGLGQPKAAWAIVS